MNEREQNFACCDDWLLAQARNPHLTATEGFQFKPWIFCPWCGVNRAEHQAQIERFIELVKDIGSS